MPVLNPYERRMLKKKQEAERVVSTPVPPAPPRVDPQHANRVQRIRFGPQALRDFPRLASRWASDYER